MPPAMPNTPETKAENTMVTPIRASVAAVMRALRRARQCAVDHVDRVLDAVYRRKRTEAGALLLAEQHLVEHVEPVERHPRSAVLGFLRLVEERRTPADFIDHVLDILRGRFRRKLRQCVAEIGERLALDLGRLAEFLRRQHEIAEVMDG